MKNELAAAARDLEPQILAERDVTEAARRLGPKTVEGLINSGLCRFGLAPELAGPEADPADWLEALEVLAGHEASVAWIAWNHALVGLFARFLAPASREALFADPSWLYAQSTRPTGTAAIEGETLRVRGRWALVSGCELAEWLLLTCRIQESGAPRTVPSSEPETRFVFVARRDARILDTWYAGGLRGSGSHDVVVDDVRVPWEHSLSPADGSRLDAPIGRVPILPTIAAGFAAQTLGVARRCLDSVAESARTQVTPGSPPGLRDLPAAQAGVALAGAGLGAARAHLHRTAERLWQGALDGRPPRRREAGDVFAAVFHANDVARRTVEAMFAAGGTSAVYTSSPLERAHRDLHVMLRHVVAQPLWLEDAGRVAFGLDPQNPLFDV